MYSARDRVEQEEWLARIDAAAEGLDLGGESRTTAEELFLRNVPEADRSKPAAAAAALYAASLVAGEERSQAAVADAMGVARLSVQQKWKPMLEDAGFRAPSW